ncbi:hypothetical protein M8845_00095 [Gelidibacter japonicus]|uniref:hypothetical protein n=1 Tax=Gelidibacter japonicus TaxID=1962232 RepID=UPI0020218483|nr:hypothetical protein [Gelidibacter japonicus]MCL8005815.1 hypothetical protein [Gelidibacter japonicus]
MSANIDFKNLWKQQEAEQPELSDLMLLLRSYKNKGLKRLVLTNVLLVMTMVGLVLIWYYFQPQLITTKIGLITTILAMLIFVLAYNTLFKYYKSASEFESNSAYLKNLITIKRKQKFMQTTMLQLYFILLSLGVCLYLYEYVKLMPTVVGFLVYALTLAWLAFNWFYLRPKTIKKQEKKLDILIKKFEMINRQLDELDELNA